MLNRCHPIRRNNFDRCTHFILWEKWHSTSKYYRICIRHYKCHVWWTPFSGKSLESKNSTLIHHQMSLSFSSSMCFTCFWKIATSYWRPHKRYIFTFSHSAKRSEYEKFQHFAQTEPRKLLKPAQTRWLSLEQCIQRIIEQWPALELYFEKSAESDRLVSSQNIFTALKNPIFKLYFYFLSFVYQNLQTSINFSRTRHQTFIFWRII